MNTPINIEIAEILFKKHGVLLSNISDVVMWLYDKHGIWIEVYYNNSRKKFYTFWNREEYTFNSPTEAYSAVIKYTLKHLI